MEPLKDLQLKPVDHQYPKFSSCERSTLNDISIHSGDIQISIMAPLAIFSKIEMSMSSEVPGPAQRIVYKRHQMCCFCTKLLNFEFVSCCGANMAFLKV